MSVPAMAIEVLLSEAVPNTSSSNPSLTANTNPVNTPQVTGAITVPQAPSGAITTNTGRSNMSTEVMSADGLTGNPLIGWNGVRTPTNPV